MKIISWNVNGFRSVFNKGFSNFVKNFNPQIICLQEIKAQEEQLKPFFKHFKKYHCIVNQAEKKGYSGTMVLTKTKPKKTYFKLGFKRFDSEGRIIRLEYNNLILYNLYMPHGGRGKENLEYKLEVYEKLLERLNRESEKNVILAGDFNIAHREIDLERPENNKNNIMFTPEERGKLDKLVSAGFVDSFRMFNQKSGNYSWWPYYRNARERNLGWRIDYVFVGNGITKKIKDAFIMPQVFGSDHCPVGLELVI